MPPRIRRVAAGTSFLGVILALGASLPSADVAQAAAGRPVAKIKHVVVIYQENHSFDNVLGAVCRTCARRCDGFTGTVTLKSGARVPMAKSPDIAPTIVHSVESQLTAIDAAPWTAGPASGVAPPSATTPA